MNTLDIIRLYVTEYINNSYPEFWDCYWREAMQIYATELLDKWQRAHGKRRLPNLVKPMDGKKTWTEYRNDGLAPIGDKYIRDEFGNFMDESALAIWSDTVFNAAVWAVLEAKWKLMAERRSARYNIG